MMCYYCSIIRTEFKTKVQLFFKRRVLSSVMENQMQINPENKPEIIHDRPLEKRNSFQKDYFNRLNFIENEIDQNNFMGERGARKGFKLALWTWASAAVDHLIIMAVTCLFLIVTTLILKSSLKNLGFSILGIYSTISMIYFILFRVFLGASIGEYSCSLRLGKPTQRLKINYSLRVFIRTISIMVTGIITLPILSLIFKKDIAGKISGISIYSLK
jgi:hypothetical protein